MRSSKGQYVKQSLQWEEDPHEYPHPIWHFNSISYIDTIEIDPEPAGEETGCVYEGLYECFFTSQV